MISSNPALAVHPAGWPFIGIFLVITLLLFFAGWPFFLAGILLTAWCVYFFRDPERVTPQRDGLILSPADGKIVAIKEVVPEPGLGLDSTPRVRISIFLNLFDVHVNRAPIEGKVINTIYRKGKFVNASLDKASVDNERMAVVMEFGGQHAYSGQLLGVVQIAGLVARRILCNVRPGYNLKAGERFGIIRFGSRADIYLPPGMQPMVIVGQYMIGGETVLADCQNTEPARKGTAQ